MTRKARRYSTPAWSLRSFTKKNHMAAMLMSGFSFNDVLYVLDADDLLSLVILDVLAIELPDLLAVRVPKVLALHLAE